MPGETNPPIGKSFAATIIRGKNDRRGAAFNGNRTSGN
jgi:hypothetical protein